MQKTSIQTLLDSYDWHTRLFKNVIEGISDKDSRERLNTKANHVAWIAGSIVQGRFELGKLLGLGLTQTSDELFKNNQGIKEDGVYPALDEYREDWEIITPELRTALEKMTNEQMASPDPFDMPGGPYTFFETLVACFDRESYCIGQIGLWRRLLGYEAMKYQ